MIRERTRTLLNGYLQHPKLTTDAIDQYIVPAMPDAGIQGAAVLARRAYEHSGAKM